jgi:polar amino acid transport system substrate-binding protein
MKKSLRFLVMMVALLAIVATADAQQATDTRVADLVSAGKLRVALFLPQYTKDPATGELRGNVVYMEVARALAARLGVEVQLVGYPTPPTVVECLKAGACDVAFMGINPSRAAEVGFTPPVVQFDFTYLVPAGSSIRSVADADRPGVRIAVVRDHESTLALSHILKQAKLVYAETPGPNFDLLRTGHANVASARPGLLGIPRGCPAHGCWRTTTGPTSLRWRFEAPGGQLAYFNEFIEEAKASGLVQRAIERAASPGFRWPRRDPTAQK